jgi:methylglutamate dehydrogenase subunit D
MAERLSALAHLPAAPSGALTLSEAPYVSILQIRAWPETLSTVTAVLISELLDEQVPLIGSAFAKDGAVVASAAPGRFMLASADAALVRRLETAFLVDDAAVTDISHGRMILRLDGASAEAVLQKCVMIDLSQAVFPPGMMAETAIHHIDVLIHRHSETVFELWVLRSFAEALAEWLLDQGLDQGIGYQAV